MLYSLTFPLSSSSDLKRGCEGSDRGNGGEERDEGGESESCLGLLPLLPLHGPADPVEVGALGVPCPFPLCRLLPPRLPRRLRARCRRILLARHLLLPPLRSDPRRLPAGQRRFLVRWRVLREEPLFAFPYRIGRFGYALFISMGKSSRL